MKRNKIFIDRPFLIGLFILLPFVSYGLPDIMRIGLFHAEKVQRLSFSVEDGRYGLYLDGRSLGTYAAEEEATISLSKNGKLRVLFASGKKVIGERLSAEKRSRKASFRLQKKHPYQADRIYPGELNVRSKAKRLQCINRVPMSKYLSGVVLAEAGKGHHPEFYKVQAIICRTYALHNLDKFSDRGIHLCDKVACQVYAGMNTAEPLIDSAVRATEGIVIVNDDIELITAAYHSNSGGRTVRSEHAWSKPLSYLRPVADPFSKKGKHYRWQRLFPKKEWLNYLERTYGYPSDDPWYREYASSYCPPDRRVHFAPMGDSIPLEKIRRDLNLNSTYFTIQEQNDSLLFRGKGFGHGVGLSQEGAMQMAELGIPYDEIISFYYQKVHLVKIRALDFFRDKNGP